MKIKYFMPLILEVKAKGPKGLIDQNEIRRKIEYQVEDLLIHWQQSDGVEVTARATIVKET